MAWQPPPVQVTSQAQAAPHAMSPQELAPLHEITHCDPPSQVISPHAFAPLQVRRHWKPVGHVKLSPPVLVTMHVCGVVVVLHASQCAGQSD